MLFLELVPLLIGIVASPLALMALIAVLLSQQARRNGPLFVLGWAIAVIFALIMSTLLFSELDLGSANNHAPWVVFLRLGFAVLFAGAAVWTYRSARAKLRAMAAATTPEQVASAAPQLPGWLQAVEKFTPARTVLLGLGIFLLNPINVSCAVVAAIDMQQSDLDATMRLIVLASFAVLSIVPMAVPVVLIAFAGPRATDMLQGLRAWITAHNAVISAAFLLLVAFTQLQKAVEALS